MTLYNMKFLQ
uniref:Uncharacterized protein n=1 Tax=Anguilla anguilla TaxID=7936 RepID=A0A0E9TJY7_ANGAN